MILRWMEIGERRRSVVGIVVLYDSPRSALRSESARGLAQSKTLARIRSRLGEREASWSAMALHRFDDLARLARTANLGLSAGMALRFKNRSASGATYL